MVLKAAPGTFPPSTAPEPTESPTPILVVGMPPSAPLPEADLYVGAPRYLELVPPGSPVLALGPTGTSLAAAFDRTADVVAAGRRVCVLAQGDPGFFGIGRALSERFGPGSLEVHPAPSLVSLAFARVGLPWDDAVVVSAQGRNPGDALMAAHRATSSGHKVAVLSGPDAPPERIGYVLLEAWAASARANEATARPGTRRATAVTSEPLTIVVCSRIGTPREQVTLTDAAPAGQGHLGPDISGPAPARRSARHPPRADRFVEPGEPVMAERDQLWERRHRVPPQRRDGEQARGASRCPFEARPAIDRRVLGGGGRGRERGHRSRALSAGPGSPCHRGGPPSCHTGSCEREQARCHDQGPQPARSRRPGRAPAARSGFSARRR